MNSLSDEVSQWNTPIIGAFLLWHFAIGYKRKHATGDAPVVLLFFIAIGILTSFNFMEKISRRRQNLESFVRSFTEKYESDLLTCLQSRIIKKRAYTSAAIDIAVSSGLLVWDYDRAILYPVEITTKKRGGIKLGKEITKSADKAEILGEWFSEHDISSITSYLGVVL